MLSGSHHVPRIVMYPSHQVPNCGFTSWCRHSAALSAMRITSDAVSVRSWRLPGNRLGACPSQKAFDALDGHVDRRAGGSQTSSPPSW